MPGLFWLIAFTVGCQELNQPRFETAIIESIEKLKQYRFLLKELFTLATFKAAQKASVDAIFK